MFNYLFQMGPLGIVILFFICLVMLSLALPYFYTAARLVSKAWHKSKEQERTR